MSAIVPFNGMLSDVPDGFVVCDGANGTPNLVDTYCMGVTSDETPGSSVGQESREITSSEINTHTHDVGTGSGGDHSHSNIIPFGGSSFGDTAGAGSVRVDNTDYDTPFDENPEYGDGSFSWDDHEHGGSINVGSAGSGTMNFNNRPKSKKLLYIMEVE